jgi:hypothetical protein
VKRTVLFNCLSLLQVPSGFDVPQGGSSIGAWIKRHRRHVILAAAVLLFLVVLTFTGLVLVLFGAKTPVKLTFPVW